MRSPRSWIGRTTKNWSSRVAVGHGAEPRSRCSLSLSVFCARFVVCVIVAKDVAAGVGGWMLLIIYICEQCAFVPRFSWRGVTLLIIFAAGCDFADSVCGGVDSVCGGEFFFLLRGRARLDVVFGRGICMYARFSVVGGALRVCVGVGLMVTGRVAWRPRAC